MNGGDSFFYAGIVFSIALALFLGGCALSLFLTEPSDELGGDWADGDCFPFTPGDYKAAALNAGSGSNITRFDTHIHNQGSSRFFVGGSEDQR